MGFDYFRNWCHGGDRDLHGGDCSREFISLDHFDCDCGFALAYLLFFAEFASHSLQPVEPLSYLMPSLEFPAWIAGWLTVTEFMTIGGGFRLGRVFQGACWPVHLG